MAVRAFRDGSRLAARQVRGPHRILVIRQAPNVLLIPGTGSVAHLRENLAAEGVTLDDEALRKLDGVGA